MEEKDLTQIWLANQLGKSYNTVNSYVYNRKQLGIETILRILEILDIEPSELLIRRK